MRHYGYDLGEFSNTSYAVFEAETVMLPISEYAQRDFLQILKPNISL